jgi:hypothetical protein
MFTANRLMIAINSIKITPQCRAISGPDCTSQLLGRSLWCEIALRFAQHLITHHVLAHRSRPKQRRVNMSM